MTDHSSCLTVSSTYSYAWPLLVESRKLYPWATALYGKLETTRTVRHISPFNLNPPYCDMSQVSTLCPQLVDPQTLKDDTHRTQAAVMATLALIGGLDNRPRLGGSVTHGEWGPATITRIASNGKVTVQCHELRMPKVCRLTDLQVVSVW